MARPRRIPRSVRRTAAILAALAALEFIVLPQLDGAQRALNLLARVNPILLLLGVGLEGASLLAYFQLTRSLLPVERRPTLGRISRIELSSLAVSHLVPGGSAAGGALSYRLLTEAGTPGSDVAVALAAQGVGSAVVLNALLWLALVASIPARGFQPVYTVAAVVGVIVFGAGVGLVLAVTRREEASVAVAGRLARHLPFVEDDAADRLVRRVASSVAQLTAQPRLLNRAGAWAVANWTLDAASLWVFVAAFGHRVAPDGLLVGYGLANVLAAIPLTPGGLGVVEGVLTPTLVGFGTPSAVPVSTWASIPPL